MKKDDSDVKKYRPQKNASWKDYKSEFGSSLKPDLSDEDKALRRRQENYLFKGFGTMMDTSEVIDFADGE